ncbi:MAG: hypothetical protein DRH11_02345 [Deltaproteobacteria bacterium]|nr:MAG: hypothetical protein DRH11_02345 [Deltaproteobacteria bacterium]
MKISFKKIEGKTSFMNPMKNHALDEIPFEIRFDPLTGETGRVFDLPFKAERPDLSATIERSRKQFCPFCEDKFEKATPLFPKEFLPEGRLRVGQALLIPNLVPFDKYAGVAVFSSQHYIPIEELTPEKMYDVFMACSSFVKRVAETDPQTSFFSINWNYMPPSGSSIVHPHLQVNCGEVPTNELRAQVEGSSRYQKENGRSFWEDLVETEKESKERYIGEIGTTFWSMNFVPFSFLPDVLCVFAQNHSLASLDKDSLRSFLDGLSRIIAYFNSENILSYNMSVFSTREEDFFRVNARISPRLFPRAIGNNDMAYLQALHKEPFTVRPPEAEAPKVREFFH